MENIYLSNDAYKILQEFFRLSPMPTSEVKKFSEKCIEQLYEYGLIENHITSYDTSGSWIIPKFSEYYITEKGKGYLIKRQNEDNTLETLRSMAASAEEQARSAKTQAELAIQAAEDAKSDAKKAKREACFSKVMAILSLIVAFLSPFFSEYADQITKWFLGLF